VNNGYFSYKTDSVFSLYFTPKTVKSFINIILYLPGIHLEKLVAFKGKWESIIK